ncbi:MAG: T9SS type A sorting domain-containing protein [Flavobacteriales bacterium]|nr:T9SS type A sorting domain-containing protein [Flavobacteriales bacterium]
MKHIYLLTIGLLTCAALSAQVNDVVEMGPGYANQVWYSMENGEIGSAPLDEWDLAFEINGFSASIRANSQKGLIVYQTPYAISEWESLTSLGGDWPQLADNSSTWSQGAFNTHYTSELDLGWGIYNPITHFVTGDSLFVVELANGSLKKLRIDALASGVYTFTYSDLDGSNEEQKQLVKAEYPGKNFGYFRFDTGEMMDREPANDTWDITFTQYMSIIPGFGFYPVTGIQHNLGVRVAEVAETPVDEADPWSVGFDSEIDVIGSDWKALDGFSFVIVEDLSYFVEDIDGDVYQIFFTGFTGQSMGITEFTVTEFSLLSAENGNEASFGVYPNPVSAGQILSIDGEIQAGSQIQLFSIDGKLVHQEVIQANGLLTLNTAKCDAGIYIVNVIDNENTFSQKVVINK